MIKTDELHNMCGLISLTLACNIRHTFCFQRSFSNARLPDKILYEKLIPLYEKMDRIRLLGGEPTIIPGIKPYILWLKNSYPNINIEIVTNGIEFDSEWIDLAKTCDLAIQVSVNAYSEEVFRKILRVGKANIVREKIYNNLEKLIEAHNTHSRPIINCITMVLNKDTAEDMANFVKYALGKGLNVTLQNLTDIDNQKLSPELELVALNSLKYKYFCKDYIEITVLSITDKIRKNFENIVDSSLLEQEKIDFLSEVASSQEIKKTRNIHQVFHVCAPETGRCINPTNGFAIIANGMMYPCNNLTNYPLGNIFIDSMDELLYGERRKKLQSLVDKGDYSYCWSRCGYVTNPETCREGLNLEYKLPYEADFDSGNYSEAAKKLEDIQNTSLYGALECYRHAFCMHVSNMDREKAEVAYTKALRLGFDEFWVKYNRGSLYLDMGKIDKARSDILRVYELNPTHEGAKVLFDNIQKYN